jgi:hypothetical protein
MAEPQTMGNVDRSIGLFERPVMDILDKPNFAAVKQAIADSFSASGVENFLASLERSGLRIRNFEAVLTKGKLGAETAAQYAKLDNADQGQIREFYLASLEQVEINLRDKYFKLYAYY